MSDYDNWLTNEALASHEDRSIDQSPCFKCGAKSSWFTRVYLNASPVRVCERCVETREKEGTNDHG